MPRSPEELHQSFVAAFNLRDIKSIVALYEPEAVIVSHDGPVRGLRAIETWYQSTLAASPVIVLDTLSVNVAVDLAVLHGRWTVREAGPNGAEVRREGRSVEAARRQADGDWLFVIDNPSMVGS
jgi:ketosteroid isomerase-like protein